MLRFIVAQEMAVRRASARMCLRLRIWLRRSDLADSGQATAEYALVLLGAAAVALLLVGWATRSGKVTQLLDGVIDKIIGQL